MHRIVGDPVHPFAQPRPFAPWLFERRTRTWASTPAAGCLSEVAPRRPTMSHERHLGASPSPHVGVLIHWISFQIHRMVLLCHSQSGVSCDPVKKELTFLKPLNARGRQPAPLLRPRPKKLFDSRNRHSTMQTVFSRGCWVVYHYTIGEVRQWTRNASSSSSSCWGFLDSSATARARDGECITHDLHPRRCRLRPLPRRNKAKGSFAHRRFNGLGTDSSLRGSEGSLVVLYAAGLKRAARESGA